MIIWERIGIVSTVIAVIGTLIFSVWDKWDYKKQIAKNAIIPEDNTRDASGAKFLKMNEVSSLAETIDNIY